MVLDAIEVVHRKNWANHMAIQKGSYSYLENEYFSNFKRHKNVVAELKNNTKKPEMEGCSVTIM